jgi:hypothetical protein
MLLGNSRQASLSIAVTSPNNRKTAGSCVFYVVWCQANRRNNGTPCWQQRNYWKWCFLLGPSRGYVMRSNSSFQSVVLCSVVFSCEPIRGDSLEFGDCEWVCRQTVLSQRLVSAVHQLQGSKGQNRITPNLRNLQCSEPLPGDNRWRQADWEDLVCAVINCEVCESVIML